MRENSRIVDPEAAAVFAAPTQRKILLSLIGEARSLGQLSRLTELPLNLLHHHVRKLIRLGLVRIEREQKRAGAPIKFYRSTARSFFVPAESMSSDPGAGLNSRLRELLARGLSRSIQGVAYSHDGNGPRMRLVKDERDLATELWLELRLSEADAAALAEDLRKLLHRYEGRPVKGRRRYLIHAAVAPA